MLGFFGYFRIMGSVLLLPLSAWLLMLFAGVVAEDVGINAFGYGTAILATLGLWLATAPMGGGCTTMRKGRNRHKWMHHAGFMPPEFGWRHEGEAAPEEQ